MHYKILFTFLILINSSINSQDLDSIFESKKKIVESIKIDSKKAIYLFECGEFFYSKSISKSEYFYKEALFLSKDKNNIMEGKSNWKLGVIERKKGDLGSSLIHLTKAKKIFEENNDSERLASIHFDIGHLYRYKNQSDKELEFYKKGLKLSKGKKEKTLGKGYIHFGNFYTRKEKLDSSIYYYNKALDIFKKLKTNNKVYNVYNNLANTYYKQGKYKKVIDTRTLVLKYAKASNNKMLLAINYHNIAIAYHKTNKYETALKYIDSAIVIAEKERFKVRLSKSYKSKSAINYKLKKYKQAHRSYKKHKIYSDSIFQSQLSNKIKEVEINKNLQLENQKQAYEKKLYLSIFSILFLLCLLIIFLVHKNAVNKSNKIKEKLNREKTKKEVLSQKFKTSETEIKKLVAGNSMRLEFLKQLLSQIKKHKTTTTSSDVKDYIRELTLKIQQQITTESKLTLLKNKIDSINDDFGNKLITMYSELTKTEREVCALLRLDLSIKEIASIRNSSIDAVKAIRYRIRKKMNIPKEQKLEFFIQNL